MDNENKAGKSSWNRYSIEELEKFDKYRKNCWNIDIPLM
jgi:hypothetical protein